MLKRVSVFEMVCLEKTLTKTLFVGGEILKFFQGIGELWVVEEHLLERITLLAVFASEMLTGVADDFVERHVLEITQAVSISATKHNLGIYITIGGGNKPAIDAARRLLAMGTMVLDGFGNGFDFFGREKLAELLIFAKHLSGDFFVVSGVDMMAEIVISGNGIDDVRVEGLVVLRCPNDFGELETAANNIIDMPELMTPIIFGVFWEDVSLDIGFQTRVDLVEGGRMVELRVGFHRLIIQQNRARGS